VILTERYLFLNPSLICQIRQRAKPRRQLVILDEGLFVRSAIVRRFTTTDLERFRDALTETQDPAGTSETGIKGWLAGIDFLLDREVELQKLRRFWPSQLRFNVLQTQRAGYRMFKGNFRYLAPELELLNSTITTGQWRDGDTFEIAVRVDTRGSDVVIMAAYVDADILEERLSRPVISLFSDFVFRHSKTRLLNIADPIGTATTLSCSEHFNRVVDFFLALTLRNAAKKLRTVLVSRKRFVARIIARIEGVSAALGRPLKCVQTSSGQPFDLCEPMEIAVINYGIVGVNSLQSFDALYCIGGYYARTDHLNDVYQQSLSPETRMPISVRIEGRRRRVYAADRQFNTRYHARRAEATHRLIERHVVLQAVGRIRPFTTPAQVILFQCDDLTRELGSIDEFASLGVARRVLDVPTLARINRAALGEIIRARRNAGESLRAIAADLGISPSTASLAAREEKLDDLLARIRL